MTKQFDLLVFIGRFQPIHRGHIERVRRALEVSERVLILVGSSNRARSPRNPFTVEERIDTITHIFGWEIENGRIFVHALPDYLYNDNAWMTKVRDIVNHIVPVIFEGRKIGLVGVSPVSETNFPRLDSAGLRGANTVGRAQLGATDPVTHEGRKIGLVGFSRDHTSYYLNMFSGWSAYETDVEIGPFNSTSIRKMWYEHLISPGHLVDDKTMAFMHKFMLTDDFKWLLCEHNFNNQYKQSWINSPFPPTIMTVDPVVIQSGHVLLVERGAFPGKGLLAFPGGHLDQDELLIDAVVRELREETNISDGKGKIPPAILKSYIKKEEAFDHPERSERARVITHAYLFELPNRQTLFEVKGGSDAAGAKWYPISDIKGPMMFEDHYFIMCKLLGLTIE